MLLSGEQDFTAGSHDSFDGNSLVMVTLRQATSKASPPAAKAQQKPVVVTIEYGQTLGEVSLEHLGQFNPEVTREIQKSNPEIRDPDLIIAGTQIRLPSPPVHADIRTPSPEDVPGRAEGQQ